MRVLTALSILAAALAAAAVAAPDVSRGDPTCATVVHGTSASETLAAGAERTRVLGLEGDDRISGSPGPDCIEGGPGNDRIAGLAGADAIAGQAGNDVLTGGAGADTVTGGPGRDTISGGAGADRITDAPARYEDVSPRAPSNRVSAGGGRDVVEVANGRRDRVHCGPGRDRVVADREDRLAGCERKTFRRSPLPQAAPRAGGRKRMFMVRFRALEEVASQGERFVVGVRGPRGCGRIETSSLGIRYRAGATVRYRLKPFGPGGRSARRWCRGRYRGTVDFVRGDGPALRFGRFSFRVR